MRKESAIIRKCSAQRTGEPFHYASIQHILSNVMNAGILRSGETKSEVFPELQIVSLEQFNRVAKTREQRSVNYAIKCGGTTETVQLEDGTEATVVRPPRAYPRKIVGKALLSGNVYCGHCGGRIFAATARKTHRPTESNERIAIYKCYNRSQHKGQCDGPSTYRAEKVDKVIEQLLRGIFERAKKVDEKTILKMLVDASAEQCQQELKAAKLEYTKTMKELSRWGDLMLDSLDGTCVFTPEQVKARLDAVQAKADEIAHQVQQLEEKSRQMKPAAADLLREHQQILTWAELFDSAAIEEKKVIASYLIKAVTLTRGYGIQVDFNISEAQFLNVAMKVDRPKKNDYQPVFLDAEELQHLFEVVKGTKLELPVLVAAFYGLRRGEVCGLKWDAIDFERGTITIRHTVTSLQVDGKTKMYAQDSAKTKSSMRTLPLVGSFAEYFKEAKAAQEVNKKVCGNCYNYEYDGYVFVDELGDLMRPEYLTSYFPQYIQKHGCKRMRFHDLRHSCASLLLANGVPLKQIQEWLGHSDFSTTANIYAHLDYTSKLSSAKAMVSGMALPESVNFGSKWAEISADDGKN